MALKQLLELGLVILKACIMFRRWLHLNSSLSPSRKSLLVLAVMLYKVHKNTGLVNTVSKGRCPWASGHNTFVNQSTHSLVLCVFLFKDIVLTVCCWLVDMNSWWTAWSRMPKRGVSHTRVFPVRHSAAFSCFRTQGALSIIPGGHF